MVKFTLVIAGNGSDWKKTHRALDELDVPFHLDDVDEMLLAVENSVQNKFVSEFKMSVV